MRLIGLAFFMLLSFMLLSAPGPAGALADGGRPADAGRESVMYGEADFAKLKFLEGRWEGIAPDGSLFYEEYDFPAPGQFRSRRFDRDFTSPSDGSTISLEDGAIVSRWGEFSWRAVTMEDGFAAFEQVNAPSNFSWRRVDPDRVEVRQEWTDEKGDAQSHVVPLVRTGSR